MCQEAARRLLNRSYHFQVRKVASLLARPLRRCKVHSRTSARGSGSSPGDTDGACRRADPGPRACWCQGSARACRKRQGRQQRSSSGVGSGTCDATTLGPNFVEQSFSELRPDRVLRSWTRALLSRVFAFSFLFDYLQTLDHLEGEAHYAAVLALVLEVDGFVVVVDEDLRHKPVAVVEPLC